MNAEKRRKKRLRNLVCIVYCSLQLLIVLALFQGMGSLLHKLVPAGIDLSQIEGKIVAVDDEQENTETIDENKLIVCLDAGHGGKDNGSDYRLRYEKNDNLKITQAVAAYLADKEDVETYDQIALSKDDIGDALKFVKENEMVKMCSHNGSVFAVEPPLFVELRITDTEPGFKGDTATGATKPAVVETGATVSVPLFVEQDDVIKIDTRTGEYLSRV